MPAWWHDPFLPPHGGRAPDEWSDTYLPPQSGEPEPILPEVLAQYQVDIAWAEHEGRYEEAARLRQEMQRLANEGVAPSRAQLLGRYE